MLSSVNEFAEIADYVLEHHERWNGKGYPAGLKEKEISVEARIIAIADTYDALIAESSYKDKLSTEKALEEMKSNSGIEFDPDILKIFIEKVIGKKL
jgi:HD-GYP domain-containing protein (c-di-GMP phosphodiesterase class II)